MNRTRLTDGSGRWFDMDKAKKFEEDTWWNGSNHVSVATGDQFVHEAIYKTAKGLYILNHWSQWQGSKETYEEISKEDAIQWLLTNGHHDEVNKKLVEAHEV